MKNVVVALEGTAIRLRAPLDNQAAVWEDCTREAMDNGTDRLQSRMFTRYRITTAVMHSVHVAT